MKQVFEINKEKERKIHNLKLDFDDDGDAVVRCSTHNKDIVTFYDDRVVLEGGTCMIESGETATVICKKEGE